MENLAPSTPTLQCFWCVFSDWFFPVFILSEIFCHDNVNVYIFRLFVKFNWFLKVQHSSKYFLSLLYFPEMTKSMYFIPIYKFASISRYVWESWKDFQMRRALAFEVNSSVLPSPVEKSLCYGWPCHLCLWPPTCHTMDICRPQKLARSLIVQEGHWIWNPDWNAGKVNHGSGKFQCK